MVQLPERRKSRAFQISALAAAGLVILLAAVLLWRKSQSWGPASYVGEQRCSECHAEQVQAWRASHHAASTQVASQSTVLGNFNNAQVQKDGGSYIFFQKDGKFYVRTDVIEQQLKDYEVPYTIGVYPYQQYLVAFTKGRLQSLDVVWDPRAKGADSHQWFRIPADQTLATADRLAAIGGTLTWNYMCADCHSTNVQRNYDVSKDSYNTQFASASVSCEACHGPGSKHVAWGTGRRKASSGPADDNDGLVIHLRPAEGSWSSFQHSSGSDTATWIGEPRSQNEINVCAPCHSLRRKIVGSVQPGQAFLDSYIPVLLEQGNYYPDGQAVHGDYEWTSFTLSKMYKESVLCSDCHDPHSGKLPAGNPDPLCGKCHYFAKFDTAQHHHHTVGSAGALCVNCHMPLRTNPALGAGRDHSFRIPRPDLSLSYGTPNACNQCHQDKSIQWAVDAVNKWYPHGSGQEQQVVDAIDGARKAVPNAEKQLTWLATNPAQPAIVRATAVNLLTDYLSPFSFYGLQSAFGDPDPLVRKEALQVSKLLLVEDRVRWAAPLLIDPAYSVRIEAARALAGTPLRFLQPPQKQALDKAISELIASDAASAERPESHMDLARLYEKMGQMSRAESEMQVALQLQPHMVPAMIALATYYCTENRNDECERWLQKANAADPKSADATYQLAMLKMKEKQYGDAINLLAKSVSLEPDNTKYSYVYAVALNASGHSNEAIGVLQRAHERRPSDRQILTGLIAFERDAGNLELAIQYAQQMVALGANADEVYILSELRLATDPEAPEYWLNLGGIDSRMGRLEKAKSEYQKGMDLALAQMAASPIRGSRHALVAYFAAALGDRARSEQEIEQALNLAPSDDKVIRRALLTYELLGERDRSIAVLRKASPQLLRDLNRQPDLTDLRDDARFRQLMSRSHAD